MWIIKVALSEQMVSSFDTPRWGVDDVKNPIGRPGGSGRLWRTGATGS